MPTRAGMDRRGATARQPARRRPSARVAHGSCASPSSPDVTCNKPEAAEYLAAGHMVLRKCIYLLNSAVCMNCCWCLLCPGRNIPILKQIANPGGHSAFNGHAGGVRETCRIERARHERGVFIHLIAFGDGSVTGAACSGRFVGYGTTAGTNLAWLASAEGWSRRRRR